MRTHPSEETTGVGSSGEAPSLGRALTAMLKLQMRCAGATLAGNDDLTTVTEEAEDFLASVEDESVNWQGAGAVGAAGAAMQREDLDKRMKPLRPCQFIDPFNPSTCGICSMRVPQQGADGQQHEQ